MTIGRTKHKSNQLFPNISVSVPVYNTSGYLRQCLDSLKMQTFKDIEFILIDDGSTDGSGTICDEYAEMDSRFRVIHQKNGGLAVARQTALENSHGKYIIVCDSDDWVEPTMYESLYQKAQETNADMVLCGYIAEYGDSRSEARQTLFQETNGVVENLDLISRGANSSWVKLIRKSLFDKTGSFYEPGINLSEDSLVHYKLMRGNPKVVQIRENLYHYRRQFGGESYTNNVRMEHIRQLEFTYRWLKENYTGTEYRSIVHQRALDLVFACMRVGQLDKEYLRSFLRAELPWGTLLYSDKSLKALIAMLLKTMPVAAVKRVVSALYPFVYK